MRILHLNTMDTGGAARGVYWLHRALVEAGLDSRMYVAKKENDGIRVDSLQSDREKVFQLVRRTINAASKQLYRNRSKTVYSTEFAPSNIYRHVNSTKPDIVNLHWVCNGFVDPSSLKKFNAPIVWTLRDTWPFTGGCHYFGECTRYQGSCGKCPQLNSKQSYDVSRIQWWQKHRNWQDLDITLVGISNWIADAARASSLFRNKRIEVIHNAVDIKRFRSIDRLQARTLLNLPDDKQLILFGAISATKDGRKGFGPLIKALQKVSMSKKDTEGIIFGSSKPQNDIELEMKLTYMGHLHDDLTLSILYSAADVMIVPSIQEAFGKTAIEAMACGTPVVSFDTSGLKDIVEHKVNGYRAKLLDTEDLADGIMWVLNHEQPKELSDACRLTVEKKFSMTIQVEKYQQLYESIIDTITENNNSPKN